MRTESEQISKTLSGKGKRRPHVVINPSDLEIFRLVYEYRFLRREHLSILTGRPMTRLHRRLLLLVEADYLARIIFPQKKHIYALGREAVSELVEKGIADPELADKRSRVHELKELGVKHEMMIVDLHVTLELASRGSPIRLVGWKEGRGLHDHVTVRDGAHIKKLPVGPDAFFTLEDSRWPVGNNRRHFFLEADRSSATHTRFRDKIRAYFHYRNQKLHEQKHGIKFFRVVTVAETDKRARNLASDARSFLPEGVPRKHYFFSSLENFSVENPKPILKAVHFSPRDPAARFALMPTSVDAGGGV